MWGFVNCSRYFRTGGAPMIVLHDASLRVDTTEKVAVLIRAGQGKSTIIRMLAGLEMPDSGTVLRDAGGWPLGYSGGMNAEMTGEANIRTLAKFADVDPLDLSAFCYDFSELGSAYHQPVKTYSSTMKGRLGMAASLGLPARTYLADDRLVSGDEAFRAKAGAALAERLQDTGLIFVASNPRQAKDVCDRYYVVNDGAFVACDDYDHACAMLDASQVDDAGSPLDADIPLFDLV